jgi:hypothetical protein
MPYEYWFLTINSIWKEQVLNYTVHYLKFRLKTALGSYISTNILEHL